MSSASTPIPRVRPSPSSWRWPGRRPWFTWRRSWGRGRRRKGRVRQTQLPPPNSSPSPKRGPPPHPRYYSRVQWSSEYLVLHGVCCWPKNDMDIISVKRKYIFFFKSCNFVHKSIQIFCSYLLSNISLTNTLPEMSKTVLWSLVKGQKIYQSFMLLLSEKSLFAASVL